MSDVAIGVRLVGDIFKLSSGSLMAIDYLQGDVVGAVLLQSPHAVGSAATNGCSSRTAWPRKLSFEKFCAHEQAEFICHISGLHHAQDLGLSSSIIYRAARECCR